MAADAGCGVRGNLKPVSSFLLTAGVVQWIMAAVFGTALIVQRIGTV